MLSKLFIGAFATLFLAGCTTDIGPAARKAGVTAISPKSGLIIPAMRMGFHNRTASGGVTTGYAIVFAKERDRLAAEMRAHDINVPQMVRERVAQILGEEKGFLMSTNAEAGLSIRIDQFGFDRSGLSLSKGVPFIVLEAKLYRGDKKIWSGAGQANPKRPGGLGAKLEDYIAQPELLRQHWEIQIDRAVRQLLTAKKKEH